MNLQLRTLPAFARRHTGETILVCGCGRSLNDITEKPPCLTIGVNDVGRRFTPDYLVVVNHPAQFRPDRLDAITNSRARAIFSQYPELNPAHAPLIRITLGTYNGTDFANPALLHYTQNSPYVALCLAIQMGAARIGLIGVDFTDDHFFGRTGRHPLAARLPQIEAEYARLRDACTANGVHIANLSPISRLQSLPRAALETFLHPPPSPQTQTRRIVSYATTPVAGVPAILARCIAARTPHQARCVWATNEYGNGVIFDGDIEWRTRPQDAEAAIAEADLLIVHNGKVEDRHRRLLAGKPIITLAHNYAWNVDAQFVNRGMPGLVVGQYQATLPDFAAWAPVPNPIPLWEQAYTPDAKPGIVTIAYTPSGRHETYPEGHRLFWHGKGYDTTMRALDALARRHAIEIIAVRQHQFSHAEALAAKRRAHIVIDECVTGSYHRNSLEGLSCGAVVVNGVGLRPAITAMLRHCAEDHPQIPFVHASCATLEGILEGLIASGPDALAETGRRNREWLMAHWAFSRQWQRFWQPALHQARTDGTHRGATAMDTPVARTACHAAPAPAAPRHDAISIVIPHRGADRLKLLRATMRALRGQMPDAEILVVEAATAPLAGATVRECGGIHLRLASDGAFERARALNAGSAIASHDLIVWHDNDLLAGPEFFSHAIAEMRERDLDYLVPYTRIAYLREGDTDAVLRDERHAPACAPVRTLFAGRDASGGMGIVHRRFLARFGGFSQEFRGWGGEDNFWWKKAALLGRAAITRRADQTLWHLFHTLSGALTGTLPRSSEYYRNVALLGEARRLHTADRFMARFPCPAAETCPFPITHGLHFVAQPGSADAELSRDIAAVFESFYGIRPETTASPRPGDRHDATIVFGAAHLTRPMPDTAPLVLVASAAELRNLPATDWQWLPHAIVTNGRRETLPASSAYIVEWDTAPEPGQNARRIAIALVQALSHITPAPAPGRSVIKPTSTLPVWIYWEGPMPDWIAQCQATIAAHAPSLHRLDPDDFALIWDRDRDLDLTRLLPAQRADFIRAFLLWRHGGIWLDSDCLLMRDMNDIQDLLRQYDFVANRDRQGYFPNGFMAAAPNSQVAAALYQRICARLRGGGRLGWISLGGEPLTETLRQTAANWHELPTARIQPICWSAPEAFFARADTATHAARFDPHAITYMLSHTQIVDYERNHPGSALLAEDTFFSYVLARSLGQERPPPPARTAPQPDARQTMFHRYHRAGLLRGEESISGPGSSLAQTATIRRALPNLLRDLGIRSLLDAGCGDCNWIGALALDLDWYCGVDIVPDLMTMNQARHGGATRTFRCLDFAQADLPRADAVLCRDTLVHYPLAGARAALRNIQRSGARILIITTFPGSGPNADIELGGWRPLDMQAPPFSFPPPLALIVENCTEMAGRFASKSLAAWPLQDLPLT